MEDGSDRSPWIEKTFRLNIREALFEDFAYVRACVRAAVGEGLIQIHGPLSIPGMTENRVVKQDVVHDVREHRLLSQSYYILSRLSLRNDTGFWLPVSTLGSYCMACYKRVSVQRSSYSLPSLLMHFGFITPRRPSRD